MFYAYLNNRRTGKDATKPRTLGLLDTVLVLVSIRRIIYKFLMCVPFIAGEWEDFTSKTVTTAIEWVFPVASERKIQNENICFQRDLNPQHASPRQESQRFRLLGHTGQISSGAFIV